MQLVQAQQGARRIAASAARARRRAESFCAADPEPALPSLSRQKNCERRAAPGCPRPPAASGSSQKKARPPASSPGSIVSSSPNEIGAISVSISWKPSSRRRRILKRKLIFAGAKSCIGCRQPLRNWMNTQAAVANPRDRIIVALDLPTRGAALDLVARALAASRPLQDRAPAFHRRGTGDRPRRPRPRRAHFSRSQVARYPEHGRARGREREFVRRGNADHSFERRTAP